ncbi:hypothetical protein K432DRAFT_407011 [Lepidopterella palustris CBS 459.81]|uniref:IgE-binding protein n=1 Tax=Lepidopterella palustris CBS 459.81 TaxID=1314670 RepID=A0A8E2E5I3_9PEZI|nr:hypothetical protein K432DRAFT_407011 [Lepidopterella palustris CBS 459.81]
MALISNLILAAAGILPIAVGHPKGSCALNALASPYTLTAYLPGNAKYDGLKAQYGEALNLFQEKVAQYCPLKPQSSCPNGTDTVFAGSLYPLSEVPGGQDLYVSATGSILITVQHSHSIPPGSYWEYQGWSWTALPAKTPHCSTYPRYNPLYNCDPPTGYFTFRAPDAPTGSKGGVMACSNEYNANVTSLYAVTPSFNRTGCVELVGLGTHNYIGVSPPVWSY